MLQKITKRDLSILIGNALEHFDTSLYGFLAPVLAPLFFPDYDPVVQLLMAYGIMSTSLITRPLGSFIFGVVARNYGPGLGLSYSLIGVAVTTVSIGFLPGYESLGWVSPVCLILMRMIRGIFASGESTIAKLYILQGKEYSDAFKASYWYQISSMLGIILASAVSTLSIVFSQDAFSWRICFWLGGAVGFIGFILRSYSKSREEVDGMRQFTAYRMSSLRLLWSNRIHVFRVAICSSFSHLTYVIPFVFLNSFVPLVTTITLENMMALNTLLLVFDMAMIPFIGRFMSQFSIRMTMISSSSILALTLFPLLINLCDASLLYVTFVRVWIVFWGVVFLCPLNMWYKRLFNLPEQYLLIGMGNALGTATVGRMSNAICIGLWYATGSLIPVATYITLIMLTTAYAIWSAYESTEYLQQGSYG